MPFLFRCLTRAHLRKEFGGKWETGEGERMEELSKFDGVAFWRVLKVLIVSWGSSYIYPKQWFPPALTTLFLFLFVYSKLLIASYSRFILLDQTVETNNDEACNVNILFVHFLFREQQKKNSKLSEDETQKGIREGALFYKTNNEIPRNEWEGKKRRAKQEETCIISAPKKKRRKIFQIFMLFCCASALNKTST